MHPAALFNLDYFIFVAFLALWEHTGDGVCGGHLMAWTHYLNIILINQELTLLTKQRIDKYETD